MSHVLDDLLMGADRLPWLANNNGLELREVALGLVPHAPLVATLEALARLRARFIAADARAAALIRLADLAATASNEETARKAATDLIKLSLIIERDQGGATPGRRTRKSETEPALGNIPRPTLGELGQGINVGDPERLGYQSIDDALKDIAARRTAALDVPRQSTRIVVPTPPPTPSAPIDPAAAAAGSPDAPAPGRSALRADSASPLTASSDTGSATPSMTEHADPTAQQDPLNAAMSSNHRPDRQGERIDTPQTHEALGDAPAAPGMSALQADSATCIGPTTSPERERAGASTARAQLPRAPPHPALAAAPPTRSWLVG
ncbi:MAG: hypothetical protein H6811_09020 [Phycisphaeraceae bacterium]|nr:hypothetical protein [Phycisphaeraceae bacterium]